MPAQLRPSIGAPIQPDSPQRSRPHRFTHAISSAVLLTIALTALVTPGVAMAVSNITFGRVNDEAISIGGNCVIGRATPSSSLHLVWKGAGGSVKANVYTPVSRSGGWTYCSSSRHLVAGDVFKANDGSSIRLFTMPNLTIVVDRAADLYRGRAPANSQIHLYFRPGVFATHYETVDLTSNSMGRWQYADPIDGGIEGNVEWYGPKGDVVLASAFAPGIGLRVGRSTLTGDAKPGQSIRVALRNGITDARMAVATAVADADGEFAATFRNDVGEPVAVGAGDRVVGLNVAQDLDWIVPQIEATADVDSDTVDGTCHDSGALSDIAVVETYRSGQGRGLAMFVAIDSSGHFEIDFSEPETLGFDPTNIKHGDRILVKCMLAPGDWVTQAFLVP